MIFAREYLSLWTGGSEDAWFNYDKMQKYRKIRNPEYAAKNVDRPNQFYLLSVDVGRLNDQTVCCVFRINVNKNIYAATLVNLFVLGRTPERKQFSKQAIDLKKIIKAFNPVEVVIDTNGLGVGLGDEMIKSQTDEFGMVYPAYGFTNDDNYKKVQPEDSIKILYGIKANQALNAKIHSNTYARLHSGMVRFLIKEQDAKVALMATKAGQKMSLAQRTERLMPHEMTTKLFEEMANLRLRKAGANLDIVLERINTRFPKDKYSAFSYGLWRIKELEEINYKKIKYQTNIRNESLVFYTE